MLSPDDIPDTLSGTEGPLVSVVLATCEPDETIKGAIRSVVNQTYGSIELVIVNGSSDEWLANLGREVDWVTYKNQSGTGVANAWNEGIAAASGEYLSFLADDDYYDETKTKKQVDALRKSEADIVYSDEYILTQDGRTVVSGLTIEDPGSHYIEYFRRGQGIPHLTVMGKTSSFERHRFDESLQAREDPHLWVRMLRECKPAYVPEPLAYKRRREDSLTGDPEMLYENELQEIELLCSEFPELADYRTEREQMARYRYGKHLLRIGRTSQSRSVFIDLLRDGMVEVRVLGVLFASLLPAGNRRAFHVLETLAERRG